MVLRRAKAAWLAYAHARPNIPSKHTRSSSFYHFVYQKEEIFQEDERNPKKKEHQEKSSLSSASSPNGENLLSADQPSAPQSERVWANSRIDPRPGSRHGGRPSACILFSSIINFTFPSLSLLALALLWVHVPVPPVSFGLYFKKIEDIGLTGERRRGPEGVAAASAASAA